MEDTERKVILQDIHEAYQLLLKIVKAKNIFSAKLENLQEKAEGAEVTKQDVEVKVHKAASLFRRKK